VEYIVYKKFTDQEKTESIVNILKEHGIDFELTEDRDSLDSLYGGNHLARQYYVKLKKDDFEKADAILLDLSEKELNTVDKDHYLYTFTDEELFEILSKPDEWNEFDYLLAKKILRERGKEINDHTIALLKKQRVTDLSKPDEGHRGWMFAGYIFALLGGLLGVFIGWHLSTFKKTLPDGQRVYGYNKQDRQHGQIIFAIGLVMFTIWMIIKFSNS
jgi:hypothetical protein